MDDALASIIKALPYALRGVSTPELPFNAAGQIVLPPSLPLSLATALQPVCEPCLLYRALDTFLKHQSPSGLLKQALFSGIRESLRSYLALASHIETKCANNELSLAQSLGVLQTPTIYLRLFHDILEKCHRKPSANVLSIVWEFTNHGDPLVANYAAELYGTVNEPYKRFITEWETWGSLKLDVFNEFYVTKTEKIFSLAEDNIPHGVMTRDEVERSYQRGLAMHFIRKVCGDVEFVGENRTFAEIVRHSRQLLVVNNQLLVHLRGLRDYMLLTNGNFVDAMFRNDVTNFLRGSVGDVANYQASEFFLAAIESAQQIHESELILKSLDAKILGMATPSSNTQVWEVFVGKYHLDSVPLTYVVDHRATRKYERCFALLWRVRLSVQSLGQSTAYLRQINRGRTLSFDQLHEVLRCHARMTHTLLDLQNYLYYNLIAKEWLLLNDQILSKHTMTIAQIKQAHETYLHAIFAVAGDPDRVRALDRITRLALALESMLKSAQTQPLAFTAESWAEIHSQIELALDELS